LTPGRPTVRVRRCSPAGADAPRPAFDTNISLFGRGVLGQVKGSPLGYPLSLGPSLLENGIVVTKASAGVRDLSGSRAFTKSMH